VLSFIIGGYAIGTVFRPDAGAADLSDFGENLGAGIYAVPGALVFERNGTGILNYSPMALAVIGAPEDLVTDGPGEGAELDEALNDEGLFEDELDEDVLDEQEHDPELPDMELADPQSPSDGMEYPGSEYEGEYAEIEYDNLAEVEWEPQPWDITRGPNWTDRVLLTFDDCMNDPDRFIAVLDHATAINVGLLIFPTGNCVIMYRNLWDLDLLQLIRERGHWVGHHSMSHPDLTTLSHNRLIAEITGNVDSNILRPPFGSFNRRVIDAAISVGKSIVYWSLDTNDWRRGSTEQSIIDFVVEYAQPGDNVLMHLQHPAFTENALSQMQAGLAARGLQVCGVAPPAQRPTPSHVPPNIC